MLKKNISEKIRMDAIRRANECGNDNKRTKERDALMHWIHNGEKGSKPGHHYLRPPTPTERERTLGTLKNSIYSLCVTIY